MVPPVAPIVAVVGLVHEAGAVVAVAVGAGVGVAVFDGAGVGDDTLPPGTTG